MTEPTMVVGKGKKKFYISKSKVDKKKFWIERETGEGGEFDISLLYNAIEKMYNKEF